MLKQTLVLLALAFAVDVDARLHHALAEDLFAFPKYRVTYLNGLPVLNDTAERWLKEGLQGGELEFLDRPWKDAHQSQRSLFKEIGTGGDVEVSDGEPSPTVVFDETR